MLIRPIQTEKALHQATKNTYMFTLPGKSSKHAVQETIEKEYKVTVVSIRTLPRKGKKTKFSRGKHAYPGTTFRTDRHIAYVTLKEGDKIKIFDEEPETTDKKAEEKKTTIKATDEQQSETTKKVGLFARRRTGRRGDK